jgi:hypothetical protein
MKNIEPAVSKMESYTGRGGNLNVTGFRKKFDDTDEETTLKSHLEVEEVGEGKERKSSSPELKLKDLINESDSSDEDD